MKKYNRVIALLAATSMSASLLAGCTQGQAPAQTDTPAAQTSESTDTAATEATEAPAETAEADSDLPTLVGVEEDTRLAADAYSELWNVDGYQEESTTVYNRILGEFNEEYQKSLETDNISERYALMAVAEAKLLGSGVFIPLSTRGGNYAVRRHAPGSVTTTLWGNDEYRLHNVIAVTDFIAKEDYVALKEKLEELRGTGTYQEEAKKYLEEKGYTLTDTFNYPNTSDAKT